MIANTPYSDSTSIGHHLWNTNLNFLDSDLKNLPASDKRKWTTTKAMKADLDGRFATVVTAATNTDSLLADVTTWDGAEEVFKKTRENRAYLRYLKRIRSAMARSEKRLRNNRRKAIPDDAE